MSKKKKEIPEGEELSVAQIERQKTQKWILAAVIFLLIITCGILFLYIRSEYRHYKMNELHGFIIGNEYIIDTFDNNGFKTLTTHGKRIDISANEVDLTTDSSTEELETLSSVITITIDGRQIVSCGDTCIFYDKDLKPDYEFYLDSIDSEGTGGISETTLIAGRLNSIRNYIGKPMVVLIKSQTGAPIYVFSGKSVFWEVAEDLPKFTKLSIDGKNLYIHRANFQIIDLSLLG